MAEEKKSLVRQYIEFKQSLPADAPNVFVAVDKPAGNDLGPRTVVNPVEADSYPAFFAARGRKEEGWRKATPQEIAEWKAKHVLPAEKPKTSKPAAGDAGDEGSGEKGDGDKGKGR